MKRLRDDKHEYLGGDLVEIECGGFDGEPISKADRNVARRLANKRWKLVDRKVGSGVDPCPRHTLYYRSQLQDLAEEEEWMRFQESLTQPLPVTFRFGGYCPMYVHRGLSNLIERDFKTMKGRFVEVGGVVLSDNIVQRIEWPGAGVYQVAADSLTLSKNEGLQPLSSVLRREVALGHIVRQELASMIPALLLGVEGGHNVLDLCAAPGSKTEQLLTLMSSHAMAHTGERPTGMVVANDPDPDRIRTLKGRYDKCLSPNFLVTCATAEDLALRFPSGPVFERILADVPCSGDGTIRKFPHIWRLFRPRMAIELHSIQLRIALAAVSMLRGGGRLVYSTCSINPIEDEAVVAALLREHWRDGLRLIDTRAAGLLPLLWSRPGVSSWRCDEDIFLAGESADTRQETLRRLPPLVESLNPPSEEESRRFHLNRCHRILPQDNDTGGFFVAVLELRHVLPSERRQLGQAMTTGKKKVGESVDVMRQLGYNPKRIGTKSKQSTDNRVSGLKNDEPSFRDASYDVCNQMEISGVLQSLNIDLQFDINNKSNPTLSCGNCFVKSNIVKPSEYSEYSLVSTNVMEALHSWAQPSPVNQTGGSYSLVHAGVPVAYRDIRHPIGNFVAPFSAHTLQPLVPPSNICRLGLKDFSVLSCIGASEDADFSALQLSSMLEFALDETLNHTDHIFDPKSRLSSQGEQSIISIIRNMFLAQPNESDQVYHVFVVADCKIADGDKSDIAVATTFKKRLSKAEKKLLKKAGHNSSNARSTATTEGVSRQPSRVDAEDLITDGVVGGMKAGINTVIVIRCEKQNRYGAVLNPMGENADFKNLLLKFSFATPQAVCKSYFDSFSSL